MKRIAIFAAGCGLIKLGLAMLSDSVILALFCRVPAEVAAFYYGVPVDSGTLSFTAHGVTLAVTRACAAADFFALVAAVLLTARMARKMPVVGRVIRAASGLFFAWIITLAVNSLRIIALVPVDALFPKDHMPIVHLLAGVAFFLPAFAGIWYCSCKEDRMENEKST